MRHSARRVSYVRNPGATLAYFWTGSMHDGSAEESSGCTGSRSSLNRTPAIAGWRRKAQACLRNIAHARRVGLSVSFPLRWRKKFSSGGRARFRQAAPTAHLKYRFNRRKNIVPMKNLSRNFQQLLPTGPIPLWNLSGRQNARFWAVLVVQLYLNGRFAW